MDINEQRVISADTKIGRFIVETTIGYGGMGTVYRARQPDVGRRVALKVLEPDFARRPNFVQRFFREARVMGELEHPAIVAVYDAGEADGRIYLAMQLIAGANLKEVLRRQRPDLPRALSLLRRIAEALDYAHGRGIIHLDIKPANILLDEEDQPHLADFGVAKALGDISPEETSQYLGTPRYMAPEQATSSSIGHRADLYSFAAVAFELITGTAPYGAQNPTALLLAHHGQPIPLATDRKSDLPSSVDKVFERGLAKSPTDRFASAAELVSALDQAVGAQDTQRTWRRRWAAMVLLLVTAVGIGAILQLGPGITKQQKTPAASVVPAPSAPPALPQKSSDIPRGPLVYEAAMDGTGRGFQDTVPRNPNPAGATVKFAPGALEISTIARGGRAGTDLNLDDGVTNFVGDIELSVRPGSDLQFCWSLRWAVQGKLSYQLCVDTLAEFAQLFIWDGRKGIPITSPVPVAALQTGRIVPMTVVVQNTHLALYVDGGQAADAEDHQVPPNRTIPGLNIYGKEGGTVLIHGIRLYELSS